MSILSPLSRLSGRRLSAGVDSGEITLPLQNRLIRGRELRARGRRRDDDPVGRISVESLEGSGDNGDLTVNRDLA